MHKPITWLNILYALDYVYIHWTMPIRFECYGDYFVRLRFNTTVRTLVRVCMHPSCLTCHPKATQVK